MRQIEFIFWGIACFTKEGKNLRVMLPDGRISPPNFVTVHLPWLWIRATDAVPDQDGTWFQSPDPVKDPNNFLIYFPGDITITGLNKTASPDTAEFDGRLPSLKESDRSFDLAPRGSRESIAELVIDCGVLSVHEFDQGAIGTKWVVQAEDDADVIIDCAGQASLTLDPKTTQVTIANGASTSFTEHSDNHFVLYRKLAADKKGGLDVKKPKKDPIKGGAKIDHPPTGDRTPFVDCSNSHYP